MVQVSEKKINQAMFNGRPVHARPSSASINTKKKYTITREELKKANSKDNVDQSTTLLDENELSQEAKLDRKPKRIKEKKDVIYNPNTTVLGFEGFDNADSLDDNADKPSLVDGRIPVKEPSKSKEKKIERLVKSNKPSENNTSKNSKLVIVDRNEVEKPKKNNLSNDNATTVISEDDLNSNEIDKMHASNTSLSDDDKVQEIPELSENKKSSNVSKNEPSMHKTESVPKPKHIKESEPKNNKKSIFDNSKKFMSKKNKKKVNECILVRVKNMENIKVTGEKFVVGKSKHSNYQVKGNNTVSRSHVFFTVNNEGVWIEDNASKNGTCLDGIYLTPHEKFKVSNGQTLRLSDEVFLIKIK